MHEFPLPAIDHELLAHCVHPLIRPDDEKTALPVNPAPHTHSPLTPTYRGGVHGIGKQELNEAEPRLEVLPYGQEVQTELLLSENEPFGHAVHQIAPIEEYVPNTRKRENHMK